MSLISCPRFFGAALALLLPFFAVACTNPIKEGSRIKEAAALAIKPEFQFWIHQTFVLNRNDGPIIAIAGEVKAGYTNPGDKLAIETVSGFVEAELIGIETGKGDLEVAYPGDHVALLFRGIDRNAISFGTQIVMGSTPTL